MEFFVLIFILSYFAQSGEPLEKNAEIVQENFDWSSPRLMNSSDSDKHEFLDIKGIKKQLKRYKKERRQELREKRRNRRLNQKGVQLNFNSDSPTTLPDLGPGHELKTYQPLDHDWLFKNLTSIWQTLGKIQRDLDQIRKPTQKNSVANRRRTKKMKNSPSVDCETMTGMKLQDCYGNNRTECSGRGQCVCGSCYCDAPYYGTQCQCDDEACPIKNGVMCGGTKQGQCRCGSCVCRPSFTGNDCQCSTELSGCTNHMGDICSRHGACRCNRCYCNEGYVGSLCEESIYSASICEKLKPCVLCHAYGWFYPQCEDCKINIVKVDEIEMTRLTCVMVNLGCILKYSYDENQQHNEYLTIHVPKDLTCPSPANSEKKKLLHQPPK